MKNRRTLIIAEAGVNHNGDLKMAMELVDCAAEAGADCVKFQTFQAAKLATPEAPKAAYQVAQTDKHESQREMLERLELSLDNHLELIEHCKARSIEFLSTPFDHDSLHLLVGTLCLPRVKIGSGDLTNAPLLFEAGQTEADFILSTGMATLSDVEEAISVLGFAMLKKSKKPSRAAFSEALWDNDVWAELRNRVTLLHCTTDYPARDEDTNLRAMDTMAQAFGLPVGYSDHTDGSAISLAAVARGATVIEKHFTLDRRLPGPDHMASIEPETLKELVGDVRRIEASLGNGIKQPGSAEQLNRAIVRKGLVAARDLPAGHVLETEDIAVMRPGIGHAPIAFWEMVGKTLSVDHKAGESLE